MSQDPGKLDLKRILQFFWQGKLVLIAAALLGVLVFGYFAFFVATPTYRATTTVILDTRRENLVDFPAIVTGLTGQLTEINTEIEVLRSRVLMNRVAEDLNLIEDPEFNGALVPDGTLTRIKHRILDLLPGQPPRLSGPEEEREGVTNTLLSRVSIIAVPSSFVFRIRAASTDAVKAARIADTIADIYIAMQIETKQQATQDAIQSLSAEVELLRAELDASDARLAAFAADADLSGRQLDTDLAQNRAARLAAEVSRSALIARQSGLATATTPAEQARLAGDDALNAILALTADQGTTVAFETRLAVVAENIARDIAETDSAIAALVTEAGLLAERREASLAAQRQQAEARRDTEATRRLYEEFITRLKEANSSLGMIQPDSRILSAAVVPNTHSEPRRSQLLVIGLVVGLVIGTAVLLIRDALVDTFRKPRDLAAETGLRVLGDIPVIPARTAADVLRYLAERPTSIAAEAVRGLRTSLFTPSGYGPPRIILTTASAAGDGSTTVVTALAQNLAAMGKSVVLVDADLRRSAFDDIFGPGTGKGMISVLNDDVVLEDALFSVEPFGFDVLKGLSPDGHGTPDILSSDRFSDLIALLSDTYDVVLIDAPPVLVVPDARIVGRLVQAIIYVVRAGVTTRAEIAEGLRLLEDITAEGPVLVLNMSGGQAGPPLSDPEDRSAGYVRN
jgi:capsular exopolysaccharide synthesis family protein